MRWLTTGRLLSAPVLVGLVEYLPQVRPALRTEVLWRFDLATVWIEDVPMVGVRVSPLGMDVVVPHDLDDAASPALDHLVLVKQRLYPARAFAKEAPLVAFDMDLDPVLADERASPPHALWQQVKGQAVVEDEVVFEVAQLPPMGAEVRLPAIRPVLVRSQGPPSAFCSQ